MVVAEVVAMARFHYHLLLLHLRRRLRRAELVKPLRIMLLKELRCIIVTLSVDKFVVILMLTTTLMPGRPMLKGVRKYWFAATSRPRPRRPSCDKKFRAVLEGSHLQSLSAGRSPRRPRLVPEEAMMPLPVQMTVRSQRLFHWFIRCVGREGRGNDNRQETHTMMTHWMMHKGEAIGSLQSHLTHVLSSDPLPSRLRMPRNVQEHARLRETCRRRLQHRLSFLRLLRHLRCR